MDELNTELIDTCRQLNRLLKVKDPYHSEIVERMLNKIEGRTTQPSDKELLLEALTGVLFVDKASSPSSGVHAPSRNWREISASTSGAFHPAGLIIFPSSLHRNITQPSQVDVIPG